MFTPFCDYLSTLRSFPAEAASNASRYVRKPGIDFTRKRLLDMAQIAWLNVQLLRKSLSVELHEFFAFIDPISAVPTKSAFVQARQKLLPQFFIDLFERSSWAFYEHFVAHRWQGFRLWAVDGTGFRLPNASEMGDVFGWHGNQHNRVPSARMLLFYDVLNKIIAQAHFHTRKVSEFVIALGAISELPKDVLAIYDRGFASHIIPLLHLHYGTNCLVRMPLAKSHSVQNFVKSGKDQAIVTEPIQFKARRTLQEMGLHYVKNAQITYRLIRIQLPNGLTEVLLTTLLDKKRYPRPLFGPLYRKRWGVETCFFVLKSFFQLACFSAITPKSCWQEIYSALTLFNIQSASFAVAEPQIRQVNNRRTYDYQPNRNVAGGLLKRYVIGFFIKPIEGVESAIHRYIQQILRQLEPIRPDEHKIRKRKLMRGTERHIHEKNYRRAF